MKTLTKKIIIYLIIFSFLNLAACTSSNAVSKEALYAKCDRGAVGTLTIATDKTRFTIDEASCRINNDTLIVTGINSAAAGQSRIYTDSVAMADIRYVELEETDSGKTLGLIIGVSAAALGIFVLLAANSLGDSITKSCN